jgi:heme/copper-type cytochrome/quinol oxidase subunit 2
MRRQLFGMLFFAANMALVLLFPPHDYAALERGNVPTFDGFYFAFGNAPNRMVNTDFLTLEIMVILINAAIAWLLSRRAGQEKSVATGGNRRQRAVLLLVALNLIVVLLFPPFENYLSISKATLPTFEGFYFVFGDNAQRQLVVSVLHLEVSLILINGGLFWLLFKNKRRLELSPEQLRALARQVRTAQVN